MAIPDNPAPFKTRAELAEWNVGKKNLPCGVDPTDTTPHGGQGDSARAYSREGYLQPVDFSPGTLQDELDGHGAHAVTRPMGGPPGATYTSKYTPGNRNDDADHDGM